MPALSHQKETFPIWDACRTVHELGDLPEHMHKVVVVEKQVSVDPVFDCMRVVDFVECPDAYTASFGGHVMNATDDLGLQTYRFRDEYSLVVHCCYSPAILRLRKHKSTRGIFSNKILADCRSQCVDGLIRYPASVRSSSVREQLFSHFRSSFPRFSTPGADQLARASARVLFIRGEGA